LVAMGSYGLANIAAGVASSFFIQTKDQFGNSRLTDLDSGNTLTVTITPSGDISPPTLTAVYFSLGAFQVTLTPTQATDHTLSVYYNNVLIGGSTNPATLTFKPGPPSHLTSYLDTPSFTSGMSTCGSSPSYLCTTASAAFTRSFNLFTFDQYSNARLAATDNGTLVQGVFTPLFQPVCTLASNEICTQLTILEWTGAVPTPTNRYRIRWGSTIAGNYSVGVNLISAGLPIRGSPISVIVNPDVTDTDFCQVDGDGFYGGVENTVTNFLVQACDQFGNNQLGSVTDSFQVTANGVGPTACPKVGSTSTYRCTYSVPATCPSNNKYTLLIEGRPSGGSSFSQVTTVQADCSPSGSAFYVRPVVGGPIVIQAGVTTTITVQDQQANGNPQTSICINPCVSVSMQRRFPILADNSVRTATPRPRCYPIVAPPMSDCLPSPFAVLTLCS
jgi:hypothetical protein